MPALSSHVCATGMTVASHHARSQSVFDFLFENERPMNNAIAKGQSSADNALAWGLACRAIPDIFLQSNRGTARDQVKTGGDTSVRKLIAFDDDTFEKLKQLGRDRMANFQELADEAFADLLKKHGIPIDLKDALRKSALLSEPVRRKTIRQPTPRKTKS